MKNFCRNCGVELLEEDAFCSNCGQPVTFEEKTTNEVVYCPECGCQNEKDAVFCVACGMNLQEKDDIYVSNEYSVDQEEEKPEETAAVYCPVCGMLNEMGAIFCASCGGKMTLNEEIGGTPDTTSVAIESKHDELDEMPSPTVYMKIKKSSANDGNVVKNPYMKKPTGF